MGGREGKAKSGALWQQPFALHALGTPNAKAGPEALQNCIKYITTITSIKFTAEAVTYAKCVFANAAQQWVYVLLAACFPFISVGDCDGVRGIAVSESESESSASLVGTSESMFLFTCPTCILVFV